MSHSVSANSVIFKYVTKQYYEELSKIFTLASNETKYDISKPLTPKILSDPNHQVVKTLVRIYSMETIIY